MSKKLWEVMLVVGLLMFLGTFTVQANEYQASYTPKGSVKKGGTLRVGYVSDDAFKGIFAQELSSDGLSSNVSQFGTIPLFKADRNDHYTKGGLADLAFDRKAKTATVTIKPKTRWSDGAQVTARDLVFAYELLASPKTNSPYYSEKLENIKGMHAFHTGQAQQIKGLEVKGEKQLVLHFKDFVPGIEYAGSGYLWSVAEPYHYLKDIPLDQLAQSDRISEHALFYGPFKLEKMIPGEVTKWGRNKYYGGTPAKLSGITLEIVPSAQAGQALKLRKYDLFYNAEAVQNIARATKAYQILGSLTPDYTYLGFKVGHKNAAGESVMDKDSPLADRALRQALAYAMNTKQIVKKLSSGLMVPATSVVSPAYGPYHDEKLKAYPFDLKKADQLLDQAGYKWGKDGYRLRPNGEKLNLVIMASGGKKWAILLQNYRQLWKKIGVKVTLYGDRIQEPNVFHEKLHSDNTKFDMWLGTWSLNAEPTAVTMLYTRDSPLNYGNFATKENQALIASLDSKRAFESNYRIKQLNKWQAYMKKEAFVIPMMNMYRLVIVSDHVSGMELDTNRYDIWGNVGLVAD
ncbi:ABC transporter substrate-binding protein [Ligilactobacillus faecis]|uniref:ABC transporter substrate-binding protein n=1 Tax=Ligilactobacillus faecis TaxID=762833 RepID=UPI002468BBBB|nr:ABC transporter substrate-binding protein [Ligilactobacillus faecis]WGN90208.1 ABC transporter substrate-binding protein [Ligilactobacillus faecis]